MSLPGCPDCQCQSRTLSSDGRSVRCVRRAGHPGDHVNLLTAHPARIRWADSDDDPRSSTP